MRSSVGIPRTDSVDDGEGFGIGDALGMDCLTFAVFGVYALAYALTSCRSSASWSGFSSFLRLQAISRIFDSKTSVMGDQRVRKS